MPSVPITRLGGNTGTCKSSSCDKSAAANERVHPTDRSRIVGWRTRGCRSRSTGDRNFSESSTRRQTRSTTVQSLPWNRDPSITQSSNAGYIPSRSFQSPSRRRDIAEVSRRPNSACCSPSTIRFPPPVRTGSGSTGASQRPVPTTGRAPSDCEHRSGPGYRMAHHIPRTPHNPFRFTSTRCRLWPMPLNPPVQRRLP